ncbi:hypothetical protein [Pseudomonas gessardii]|uniref:hypothetical protein n=1 Tax=Pseudomonas gessardii TaxID=78544 RepID=UPI001474F56A|nr:hypothetical protein [Pseudomonas gessardii]
MVSLLKRNSVKNANLVVGHSRLITNGLSDNQPVVRENICVFHNGIIVNDAEIWEQIKPERKLEIDSEVIAAIAEEYLANNVDLGGLAQAVLSVCKGVVACAVLLPERGKALIFSNNGSLYVGELNGSVCFSSERFPLGKL